jgi:hypothetical protein
MPDTYVIWPKGDQAARDLIIQAHPEFLPMMYAEWTGMLHPEVDGAPFPLEPEPSLLAENNLILLGGWGANPYTKKYFVDSGLITFDETTLIMSGLGVYANGIRCIATTIRENGTTVTTVFGYGAIDTFYALQDYLRLGPAREVLNRFKGARGVLGVVMGRGTPTLPTLPSA